jgi:hypothetical protein
MSDSVAIAQGFAASQAASTRQALQTEIVRQQAGAEQAIVELLQQSAEQLKASLPAGQGQAVDISA